MKFVRNDDCRIVRTVKRSEDVPERNDVCHRNNLDKLFNAIHIFFQMVGMNVFFLGLIWLVSFTVGEELHAAKKNGDNNALRRREEEKVVKAMYEQQLGDILPNSFPLSIQTNGMLALNFVSRVFIEYRK